MSLQSLISGSECAVPSPLTQILKHADGDHSLQRDRVGPASSSSLHHLPSTSRSVHDADIALARKFFNPAAGPSLSTPSFTPTSIAHIPSPALHANHAQAQFGGDFDKWQREPSFVPPPESSWARQFEANIPPNVQTSLRPPTVESGQQYLNQGFMNRPILPGPSYMPPLATGTWDQQFAALDSGKGKGKAVDPDFDAAFAAAESQARITEVKEDTPGALEEAFSRTSIGEENSAVEPKTAQGNSDFQDVWDQLRNSAVPPPKSDLAKWEAEYNALMQAERDELEYDYANDMERAWLQASRGEDDTESGFGLSRSPYFDEDGIPDLAPYAFEPNNPYAQSQTPGHLEAAKAILSQGGSLTEAALRLEAAIQANELGKGGYEAWILLGEVRGMDEREDAGLRALREGVRRASEQDAANPDGLLSLAISYTNESYDRASQSTLMRWLRISYPSLATVTKAAPSPWAHHEEVKNAFLSVARAQHAQGASVDADLQVGLGVLFYNNGEYEKAADCFQSALSVRPTDWLLWNRLGSCLSNGSKPEEALGAYREALQLRPTYTRAIYNVGVACLNIGAQQEAAEHFLSALSLQGADDGGNRHTAKSEQLWTTLRRTFAAMDRDDLVEKAREGTPLDVFRAEGFDF